MRKVLIKKNQIIKKNAVSIASNIKKISVPSKSLYTKVIGTLTKKGKKFAAKKALNDSLYNIARLFKIKSHTILPKILSRVKCQAEVRKVVRRKNVNLIPFPVSKNRESFLKIQWFLHDIKQNKAKTSFRQKLQDGMVNHITNPESIVAHRIESDKLLLKNISNSHFR